MLSHPGQTLSIYDLPVICCIAWDRAATPTNKKLCFKCTGISPFDGPVFIEENYLLSYIMDRPLPVRKVDEETKNDENRPSTSAILSTNVTFQATPFISLKKFVSFLIQIKEKPLDKDFEKQKVLSPVTRPKKMK